MRACEMISSYLDGRLETAGARQFEEHLRDCSECAAAVEAWRDIENRLVEASKSEKTFPDPSPHEALRLVQRAQLAKKSYFLQPHSRAFPVTVAAMIVIAGALGVFVGNIINSPAPVDPKSASSGVIDDTLTYRTDSNSRTRVRLASDIISLGPSSSILVVRSGPTARLVLQEGSVACEVSRRTDGESFSVATPDFTVEVAGTRFLVDLNGAGEQAKVIVSDGKVSVRGAKIGKHSLSAGQSIELDSTAEIQQADKEDLIALNDLLAGSTSSPQATVPAVESHRPDAGKFAEIDSDALKNDVAMAPVAARPDGHEATDSEISSISKWREWVIEGRLDEARFAIRNHLVKNPLDANAWSLLADCERKRSNWAQAVVAYDKLVALSSGERANRARFKAASIIQDRLGDHEGAVKALEQFLEQGGNGTLLEARAKVRLAGSLMALNKPERAREYLLWVIEKSNDAAMISKARYLLEQK